MRVNIILLLLQHPQMPNHFERFKVWLLWQHLSWPAACDLVQVTSPQLSYQVSQRVMASIYGNNNSNWQWYNMTLCIIIKIFKCSFCKNKKAGQVLITYTSNSSTSDSNVMTSNLALRQLKCLTFLRWPYRIGILKREGNG